MPSKLKLPMVQNPPLRLLSISGNQQIVRIAMIYINKSKFSLANNQIGKSEVGRASGQLRAAEWLPNREHKTSRLREIGRATCIR